MISLVLAKTPETYWKITGIGHFYTTILKNVCVSISSILAIKAWYHLLDIEWVLIFALPFEWLFWQGCWEESIRHMTQWRWLRGEVEWSCCGNRSSINCTSPSAPTHLETSENQRNAAGDFFFSSACCYLIIQGLFLLLLLLLCCLQLSTLSECFSLSIIYPRLDISWALLQIYFCAFILHNPIVALGFFCSSSSFQQIPNI